MKGWARLKPMFYRMILFVFLCSASLFAKGRQADFCEAWGSALYWNPCAGSFVVGVSGEQVQLLGTENEVGYRAGLAYVMGDGSSVLAGEYTLFDATYSAQFGEVVARRKFRYETADARMGIALCPEGCDKFYAFLTARYLDIRETRKSGASEQESVLKGGGGMIGAGGMHPLAKCVYLCAEAGGLLGVGEQVTRQSGRRIPSEMTCFPELEARVGLRWVVPSQGYCLMAEVGYEMLYYWAALRRFQPDGSFVQDDLGFHGGYGSLRLRF